MYIIDQTYFTREYNIPGLEELRSEALAELGLFIDDKVREILMNALGNVLFAEFDALIDANGDLDPLSDQKWLNLVNGSTYTHQGRSYTWLGLKYTQGAYKKSLFVPYVYYYILQESQSELSTLGEIRGVAKNAKGVNSTQRLVKAFNEFVKMYQGDYYSYNQGYACREVRFTPLTYFKRGVQFYDYLGQDYDDGFVDLLTFLIQNDEDYPDPSLKIYEFENQLGL